MTARDSGGTLNADDYYAIQNLVYRYCDRLDRGDLDGMSSLFAHADVYLPADPNPIRDPGRIAALYGQYTRIYPDTGTPKTRHVTTNLIIEPDGDAAARAQSYVIVFQATDTFRLQPVIGGRNHDRFARVDGVWRFSERRIETDLFGDLSAHMLQAFGPR
jgi:3-phenylpropionate/cinnamic acid dioxygenase small subunit